MSLRRLAPVIAITVLAGLALAGCGDDDQSDNAAEFKDRVMDIGFEVVIAPPIEGRPGLVEGAGITEDGVQTPFFMSFGPGPEKDVREIEGRDGSVWFDQGDEVYYWIDAPPPDLPKAADERAVEMQFAIEDTACQVVAGRDCAE